MSATDENRFEIELNTAVDMVNRTIKKKTPMFMLVNYQHNYDKRIFLQQMVARLQSQDILVRSYDPKNNDQHFRIYPMMKEDADKQCLSVVTALPETVKHVSTPEKRQRPDKSQ